VNSNLRAIEPLGAYLCCCSTLLSHFVYWIVFFDPLFLDCHAIGNDLPVDRDELDSVPLNRTCGHSTSAWCQIGNGLRIVNGGSGQWKRLYAPVWGMLLMMMMMMIVLSADYSAATTVELHIIICAVVVVVD